MHQTNTIIGLRNSRTMVKRAKNEYKESTKLHTHGMELAGVKHQIVQSDKIRFNAVFKGNLK